MRRRILSVGQGAFYCESFETGENIVYDCGNTNQKKVLKDCIDRAFYNEEIIKAVFISHLHYDHISGLEYLLTHCKVQRVYLPFLTPEGLALIKLYYEYKKYKNHFVQHFLDNPKNAINNLYNKEETLKNNKETKIIFVRAVENKNYDVDWDNNDSWNEKMCDNIIESGTDVADVLLSKTSFWRYIPYNICDEDYLTKIKFEIINVFGNNWYKEILKKVNWKISTKNGKKSSKVADIFKKVLKAKDFNIYSLTLLSVPYDINDIMQSPCPLFIKGIYINNRYCGYCCYKHFVCNYVKYENSYKKPGCLYTGDYDCNTNWDKLKVAYTSHWNSIGCFQIPHHGSQYSFNDEIIKMHSFLFLSAGKKNQYNHPSPNLVYDICRSGKFFQWVNEESNSQVCFICFE